MVHPLVVRWISGSGRLQPGDLGGEEYHAMHGTLPETNSSPMKIPMFPCKYRQKGGFSMAMLVSGRVHVEER